MNSDSGPFFDRLEAQDFARRAGISMRRKLANDVVLELQRVALGSGPIFYIANNVDAADTVSTDEVWLGGSAALDLDGNGMTVGEWDGGAIFAEHPDFTGRLTKVDGATLVSNPSTHVAGTLIGAGEWLLPESRGMAYATHLDVYDWNSDTAEMAAAASNGLLISNHSYGIAAGWLYLGGTPPDRWWWIGGAEPYSVEDPSFGYYDSETQLWDQIAFDAPYYLIVKAAGNDRTNIGPIPGEFYTVIDQDGNFLFTSNLPRGADCAPSGYDCLPGSSVAKNVLTVGAVDDLIGGYSPFSGPAFVQMADFSGWGPTDDGRIKPDVVGNGVLLLSAWGDDPFYAAGAGTSMAAPNITGSLLLLQELYEADPEAGYSPDMMAYDETTGYYSKLHTSAGNKQTLGARVNITEGVTGKSQNIAVANGTTGPRAALLIIVGNQPNPDFQNTINFIVWNSTGNIITRLVTEPGVTMAGAEHTIFTAYDGDAGTAILVIDGEDGDYPSHANRVEPTTAVLRTGSGSNVVGATASATRLLDGEVGFLGMSETYLTNWSDFFNVDGNPKELDEATRTEWGAQPLFWNANGNMELSAGSAGAMAKNGTITLVEY